MAEKKLELIPVPAGTADIGARTSAAGGAGKLSTAALAFALDLDRATE